MDQLQSSSYSSSGEQQFIDKKENTVLVQIEFRYYWRMWSNISPFWSIPCWFVVMILGCANITWPVLLGCETINFCYMTRAIIHYVHDYEFETSWLQNVNREHFFCCILSTFLSYFFCKKIPLSQRVGYVRGGSVSGSVRDVCYTNQIGCTIKHQSNFLL